MEARERLPLGIQMLSARHNKFPAPSPGTISGEVALYSTAEKAPEFLKCDVCQEARALLFCPRDRQVFCRQCDVATHAGVQFLASHERYILAETRMACLQAGSAGQRMSKSLLDLACRGQAFLPDDGDSRWVDGSVVATSGAQDSVQRDHVGRGGDEARCREGIAEPAWKGRESGWSDSGVGCDELCRLLPSQDLAELDWLSCFVEESYAGSELTFCCPSEVGNSHDPDNENGGSLLSLGSRLLDTMGTHQFLEADSGSDREEGDGEGGCTYYSGAVVVSPSGVDKPAGGQQHRGKRPRTSGREGHPHKARRQDGCLSFSLESEGMYGQSFRRVAPSAVGAGRFAPPPVFRASVPESMSSTDLKGLEKKALEAAAAVAVHAPAGAGEECAAEVKPLSVRKGSKKDLLPGGEVRRCLHCATHKTPQWRAGPMGPKTLCNACGVRYKSGRLTAEYRPAGSPGYEGSRYSNRAPKIPMKNAIKPPGMRSKVKKQLKPVAHLQQHVVKVMSSAASGSNGRPAASKNELSAGAPATTGAAAGVAKKKTPPIDLL